MILVLLNWLFITALCLLWGSIGLRAAYRIFNVAPPRFVSPVLQLLVGLSLLTWAGNAVSLFLPLDHRVLLGLSLIASIVLYRHRHSFRLHTQRYIRNLGRLPFWIYSLGIFIVTIALIKAAGPTEVPDEGEYYLPLVRWIEQYAVVPGTALLHDRMGYNSAFHLSSALFGQADWYPGGMYDLNALLFVWIYLYILGAVYRLYRHTDQQSWSDLLLVAAGIFLFRKLLTSFDADYPANFIGLVVLALWLARVQRREWRFDSQMAVIFLLSIFLATVKLTAIFLLFLPALILLYEIGQGRFRHSLIAFLLGGLYLLPWLLRNYYLSGYLIYPIFWLDWFNPDWKVPLEVARANYWYISEHAKTLAVRYSYGYVGAAPLALAEWLYPWWRIMWQDIVGKVVLLSMVPAILGNIGWWFYRKSGRPNYLLRWTLVWLVLVLGFWWWRMPAIRFGWSYLLVFLLLGGTYLVIYWIKLPWRWWTLVWIGALSLSLVRGVYLSFAEIPPLGHHLILPKPVPALDRYRSLDLGGVDLIVADSVYCWGVDPPCMPVYYDTAIELRTGRVEDGFRRKE